MAVNEDDYLIRYKISMLMKAALDCATYGEPQQQKT